MSEIDFKAYGFDTTGKMTITRRNEFYNDDSEKILEPINDFCEMDFSNCNFTLEINGTIYNNFKTIYGVNDENTTKVLKCNDPSIVFKLCLYEYHKNRTFNPDILNDITFYNQHNTDIEDECVKKLGDSFYIVLWENENMADILMGYIMEYGGMKIGVTGCNDYKYLSSDAIRLTYVDKSNMNEIVKKNRIIIKNMISLHKKGIFHMDIKPENITNAAKFIDFGCSVSIEQFHNKLMDLYMGNRDQLRMGTYGYQAPELMMFKSFYKDLPSVEDIPLIMSQMDIFSMGCTIFNILFGISFYDDAVSTSTINFGNLKYKIHGELFADPNDNRVDTMDIYQRYFGEDGYHLQLLRQMAEHSSFHTDMCIYLAMIRLNPHERADIELIESFIK